MPQLLQLKQWSQGDNSSRALWLCKSLPGGPACERHCPCGALGRTVGRSTVVLFAIRRLRRWLSAVGLGAVFHSLNSGRQPAEVCVACWADCQSLLLLAIKMRAEVRMQGLGWTPEGPTCPPDSSQSSLHPAGQGGTVQRPERVHHSVIWAIFSVGLHRKIACRDSPLQRPGSAKAQSRVSERACTQHTCVRWRHCAEVTR